VDEAHFEPWLAMLEVEGFPNLLGFQMENWFSKSKKLSTDGTTTEEEPVFWQWHRYASMDFFEMVKMTEFLSAHCEQPFHINRKTDSFCIWINQRTNTYHFLANIKSHSMRVNDIGTFNVHITVALDRKQDQVEGQQEVTSGMIRRPTGLENLGVSISMEALENKTSIDLTFAQC